MINTIYFSILLVLFCIVCYMIPKAFDQSYTIDDNNVSIHKIEYTKQ